MKPNETADYDNINVSVIKKTYAKLKAPLICIFNLTLSSGIFPDWLKVAKVSPIFKNGEKIF